MASSNLLQQRQTLISGRLEDAFSVLGRHPSGAGEVLVRVFAPHIESLTIEDLPMERIEGSDFFIWQGQADRLPVHYRLNALSKSGHSFGFYDPYSFQPLIPEFDLHLFGQGQHWHIYRHLGAHAMMVDGIDGVLFSTWAPNAERVSVVGSFNEWDGQCHLMRNRGGSGVWELFIPELEPGTQYKFKLVNQGVELEKTDPYGQQFELRPHTAALTTAADPFDWSDQGWIKARDQRDWQHAPLSVYEVHLGSWLRDDDNQFLNYRVLAKKLVAHLKPLGFTHVELLPITEHPLDDSWGYQVSGYFAPTSRFGSPEDFHFFVDYLHQHGIGVLLDWVPAHFPKDEWALANFDGTELYEHPDPRRGEHKDWGTKIFNFGRNEVKNFLISSALYWIEEFHIDGIRVDAVASMLYLNYSREEGEWEPNQYGGNENLEAVQFLQHLNSVIGTNHPGVLMIAEESTSWPQVSRPTYLGGLGFSMKWNMGWMHDTLDYFGHDPVHRHFHHDKLTFGMLYSFSENFVLPFSHDEVVHGKGSMIGKMSGDRWQQFANLRLLYSYQYTYPGKKLLFMGAEIAQYEEWNQSSSLPWHYLEIPEHRGIQQLVGDLNGIYTRSLELYADEFDAKGFSWVDCNDAAQSVVSYLRRCGDQLMIVVLNFTPVVREDYKIGVPVAGHYQEIFNSDSAHYGGSNVGNQGVLQTDDHPWMDQLQSLSLTLPPLGALILKPVMDDSLILPAL